mmetsp:Transcript_17221/g.28892  ORF Transcript_17221/g.28892 Transcript_17221/m.28892 type:complete len:91 (+) Transcript_17221:1630-1902(+)
MAIFVADNHMFVGIVTRGSSADMCKNRRTGDMLPNISEIYIGPGGSNYLEATTSFRNGFSIPSDTKSITIYQNVAFMTLVDNPWVIRSVA